MKCHKCGKEMTDLGNGRYECIKCCVGVLPVVADRANVFIKQEPYIDDEGIWIPTEDRVPHGCVSDYKLVMTREMFVEAYNKWIKNED